LGSKGAVSLCCIIPLLPINTTKSIIGGWKIVTIPVIIAELDGGER
jgi:hypothetical protein